MGRRPLDRKVVLMIKKLRHLGCSAGEIWEKLQLLAMNSPDILRRCPSEKTVYKYVKEYDETKINEVSDRPFQWHELEAYELPWEASKYLLDMCAFIWAFNRVYRFTSEEGVSLPEPIVRQAKWWWRLHLAIPEAELQSVYLLAQRFTLRDLASDWLGIGFNVRDLEAYIAYRPWAGDDRREAYEAATQSGSVPALYSLEVEWVQVNLDVIKVGKSMEFLFKKSVNQSNVCPFPLPKFDVGMTEEWPFQYSRSVPANGLSTNLSESVLLEHRQYRR